MTPAPKPRWHDGNWQLPAVAQLPVMVEFFDGHLEYRSTLEGKWFSVRRWREALPADKPRKHKGHDPLTKT